MFEKKVLIEQIDDRIRRGIAVFLHIYSHILSDSAEDEEKSGSMDHDFCYSGWNTRISLWRHHKSGRKRQGVCEAKD